jgi:hypothetical protein
MKKPLVAHPFLLALFPILFLFSHNIEQMSFSQVWVSMIVVLGFTLVAFSLLTLILRNGNKAGIIVSLFLVLFFSYGHVYDAMWGEVQGEPPLGGHPLLLGGCAVILAGVVAFVAMTRKKLQDVTKILNVVALSLVAISVVNIGIFELRRVALWRGDADVESSEVARAAVENVDTFPNIYYIILDGYARADVLEELFDYDNSKFIDSLRQEGFFVANKGRANYAQTALSLASSLNLKYLDDLAERLGPKSRDRQPLEEMIHDNTVFQFLERQGYIVVAFDSGYSFTDVRDADLYMSPGWSWDEFEVALINTTPIPILLKKDLEHNPYALHRRRILYAFDHLADVSELKGPHFVFAHILAPHPPFVFGPNGEEIEPDREYELADGSHYFLEGTRDEYVRQYGDQLAFVNDKLKVAIEEILTSSSRPTIIILQADHGPGSMLDWDKPANTNFKERLSIFYALYLPMDGFEGFYDDMTPVNTFRVLFNRLFGTNYELLQDESYFSPWKRPYKFINVTADVESQ